MGKKQTIIINGRTYDAKTGLALSEKNEKGLSHTVPAKTTPAKLKQKSVNDTKKGVVQDISSSTKQRSASRAKTMHRRTQRSKTLKRSVLKKPSTSASQKDTAKLSGKKYARSPKITKFSKPSQSSTAKKTALAPTKTSKTAEHKVASVRVAKRTAQPVSSRAIKEQLIKEQMEKAPAARVTVERVKKTRSKEVSPSKLRTASVITVCFSLLILAGYLTYLSMPNLSMRIAAMQTGINAKLPEYRPQGYHLAGPTTYDDNKVKLGYKSEFGSQGYEITQIASDWDSFATLDNYVSKDSSDDYQIRSTQGLTIYTYGKKAVWVSGGVLHILKSNHTPLTNQQIERIAISM